MARTAWRELDLFIFLPAEGRDWRDAESRDESNKYIFGVSIKSLTMDEKDERIGEAIKRNPVIVCIKLRSLF